MIDLCVFVLDMPNTVSLGWETHFTLFTLKRFLFTATVSTKMVLQTPKIFKIFITVFANCVWGTERVILSLLCIFIVTNLGLQFLFLENVVLLSIQEKWKALQNDNNYIHSLIFKSWLIQTKELLLQTKRKKKEISQFNSTIKGKKYCNIWKNQAIQSHKYIKIIKILKNIIDTVLSN